MAALRKLAGQLDSAELIIALAPPIQNRQCFVTHGFAQNSTAPLNQPNPQQDY